MVLMASSLCSSLSICAPRMALLEGYPWIGSSDSEISQRIRSLPNRMHPL